MCVRTITMANKRIYNPDGSGNIIDVTQGQTNSTVPLKSVVSGNSDESQKKDINTSSTQNKIITPATQSENPNLVQTEKQPVNNIFARRIQGSAVRDKALDTSILEAGVKANDQKRQYEADMEKYKSDVDAYNRGELPIMPEIPVKPDTSFVATAGNARQDYLQKTAAKSVENPNQSTAPMTYEDFKRSLYDEESIRRKSDTRAKIMAVGDALRHIGNLGLTINHASPQRYNTAPATEERQRYEQGVQAREALAYSKWNAMQKQKIAEAEQARKDLQAQWDIAGKQSTISLNGAKEKQIAMDMGLKMEEHPYKVQKMAADTIKAIADGDKAKAESIIKQLEASNKPEELELANKLKRANIGAANARATASYASASLSRAKEAHERSDMAEEQNSRIIGGTNGGGYVMPKYKNDAQRRQANKQIVQSLRNNGFIDDTNWADYKGGKEDGTLLDEQDIIAKAIEYSPRSMRSKLDNILQSNGWKRKQTDPGYK